MTLLLLLACSDAAPPPGGAMPARDGAAPASGSPAPESSPAAAAAAEIAAKQKARAEAEAAAIAALPPAPTRARYGLTVGESPHEAVTAWIAEHALPCVSYPAPTRATFQYRCTGDLPESLLDDRTVGGLSELLIVRAENSVIHFFAATRTYDAPEPAIADYHATLDALAATFGTPKRESRVEDPSRLAPDRIVRFAGTWQFRDLDATVTLLHARGETWTVQESWQVPGVEASIPTHARTGSLSGGPGKKPPGWNPHVSDAPTLPQRSPE